KGITFVQAFQYWAKVFAISAPAFVLMAVYGGYNTRLAENAAKPKGVPAFASQTRIEIPGAEKAPANVVVFGPGDTHFLLPDGAVLKSVTTKRKPVKGEDPIRPWQLLDPPPKPEGKG